MGKKNILLAFVILVGLAAVIYTFSGGETKEQYTERIEKERERQYKFLKYNMESPLKEEQKKELDSLLYFPINMDYKVKSRIIPVKNKTIIEVPMTDGSRERYIRHSFAEFEFFGQTHRLLLLQSTEDRDTRNFFLAFADETSGEESYGGGRYLDLVKDGQNSITIDFNLAYNPYCAYNPDYACPLPPKENILSIPIQAGEKNYGK